MRDHPVLLDRCWIASLAHRSPGGGMKKTTRQRPRRKWTHA